MARKAAAVLLLVICIGLILCFRDHERGEHISGISDDKAVTAELLYTCYSLCRAVWRERSTWRDTGWELTYYSHEPTNSLALAVEHEGVLYISFRSTGDPVDTRQNLRISLDPLFFSPDSSFRAHRGMQEKYEGLQDELHRRITSYHGHEVILTGHSSGGMTAVVAYLDLYRVFPDIHFRVITFGSPRSVNRRTASYLDSKEDQVIRVVMGRDVYASQPPACLGYRHGGRLIRIGERPWWKLFSFRDHYPGYEQELSRLYNLQEKNSAEPPHF